MLPAAGWVMLGWFVFTAARLHHVSTDVRSFQVAYLIAFAGYGLLVWAVLRATAKKFRIPLTGRRHASPLAKGGKRGVERSALAPNDVARASRSWVWWLIACAVIRIPLLGTQPSDDLHRYVWEGKVQLEHVNPFDTPPDDPSLAHMRDANWAQINHPDYPAIYPPLAQMEFAAIAAVHPSVFAFKLVHVVWDVLTIAVLGACVARLGKTAVRHPEPRASARADTRTANALDLRPHAAVLYGLCPLVLTSFGIDGHVDSLMLLLMALMVWAMLAGRWAWAGVALGGAIATKLMPLILLPWLILRKPRAAIAAMAVVALCYLPYIDAGTMLFSSLRRFGTGSEFFSLTGVLGVAGTLRDLHPLAMPGLLGVIIVALAIRSDDFTKYASRAWTATLMLLPVVHFWYLTWVILFLPLRIRFAWLAAGAAFVCYFEAEQQRTLTGHWNMPTWAPVAVWTVFVVGAVGDAVIRWTRGRHGTRLDTA